MRIALFDSSATMRMITKTTSTAPDTEWLEYNHFGTAALQTINSLHLDAIVTSKEFASGSLEKLISSVRQSKLNRETPVFLFTSEQLQNGRGSA